MNIKFPSYKAAIVIGAIIIPLFELIDKMTKNIIILNCWGVFGCIMPLFISTFDFKYIRNELKKGRPFFGLWISSQDFKECFIPSWKRMFVCFLSMFVSVIILEIVKKFV